MKCDELKDYDYDPDFPFQSRGRFYVADEVEAAIAELKQKLSEKESWVKMLGEGEAALSLELEKTKQKLEYAKATAYAENVDAGMENRRLKRALWRSRVDRAIMTLDYFTLKCRLFKDYMKVEPPKCDVKMIPKWANVVRKCRAKAEAYK